MPEPWPRRVVAHGPGSSRDLSVVFERVSVEDAASLMASMRASAASLTGYKWEGRIVRDGQERWIQAASRPHREGDGRIVWDGVILDITERKRIDAAIERSFRQEETIRLQEELLAQLSTPMIPPGRCNSSGPGGS